MTALALFLPLSLLAFATAITRYHLGVRAVLATLFAGVVAHAILMGSLMSYVDGRFGLDTLLLFQIANPLLSALLVVICRAAASSAASRPSSKLLGESPSSEATVQRRGLAGCRHSPARDSYLVGRQLHGRATPEERWDRQGSRVWVATTHSGCRRFGPEQRSTQAEQRVRAAHRSHAQ